LVKMVDSIKRHGKVRGSKPKCKKRFYYRTLYINRVTPLAFGTCGKGISFGTTLQPNEARMILEIVKLRRQLKDSIR